MTKNSSFFKSPEWRSFIGFFFTGVFGAAVNFLSQIPIKTWFLNYGFDDGKAFAWSVFCAYMFSTAVSFIPAKVYAFSAKSSGNTKREYLKFFIIATVALGVQELVSVLTLKYVAHSYFDGYSLFLKEKGSHLTGMACSFMANYFGHRFFTFRSTGIYNRLSNNSETN